MSASVASTFLRGRLIYDQGKPVGQPSGRYLHRPYA
jgi:allantoinase